MNKLATSALALTVAVGLAACGGGNNKGTAAAPVTPPPIQARETLQFTGSFINGARYVSGARTGITGVDCTTPSDGCFDVLAAGDKVTFSLGSITLPEISTVGGQQQITTLDIARALDPTEATFEKNFAAIYAVLDALDASVPNPGGTRVFQVKPAVPAATNKPLAEIIADSNGIDDEIDDLKMSLATAISDSTGDEVTVDDISFEAAQASDFVKAAAGFEGGIEIGNKAEGADRADFGELNALSFLTSDLIGLWSSENPDDSRDFNGFNGLSYSDDGLLDFANTKAGTPNPKNNKALMPFIQAGVKWNIVNSTFVSQQTIEGIDFERQCIVTERRSAMNFTLRCKDFFNNFNNPLNDFDAIYNKVNLANVLSAGDGKWNFAFEQRFNETGNITFAANGSYIDSITDSDNITDSVAGTYDVMGLFLTLEDASENGDSSSCAFAGAKQNDAGQIQDIFLRCSSSDTDSVEDVVLTKRANPVSLTDTSAPETAAPETTSPVAASPASLQKG